MSKNLNICTCQKCYWHKVMDPTTGLLVQGCLLGRNELHEHWRLERSQQCFSDCSATQPVSKESAETVQLPKATPGHSQGSSSIPKSEQEPVLIPSLGLEDTGTMQLPALGAFSAVIANAMTDNL